jgi:hypothetical protein
MTRSRQTLHYSRLPTSRSGRSIAIIALALISLAVLLYGVSHQSVDIRLDTGDLRYRVLGVPVKFTRMPEPQRSQLLALAAQSTVLTPNWVNCCQYPLPTTNHPDSMCMGFYRAATLWIAEDPTIARLALEDVARYIKQTNARHGLPASFYLVSNLSADLNGVTWMIKPDWRDDQQIRWYLQQQNYTPAPPPPATSAVTP